MLAGIHATLAVVGLALTLGAAIPAGAATGESAGADAVAQGRALYLEGKREGGAPLIAHRAGGLGIAGAQAACVNCHRRSGFGGAEGRSYIPPITAQSLFEAKAPGTGASASGTGRPAYSGKSLARAIRSGIDPSGRRLDYLMPRYELRDDEIKSLVAYLRQLSDQPAQGADANALEFATVLAPGMQPERSKAMTEVLNACFDEHNAGPPEQRGRKRLGPNMSLREQPKWKLHVWQLEGKPETWDGQLSNYARRQPVFALIGGLGGGQWAPVHEFCERSALPCLFPHVEAPVAAATDFYPLYLSRSVLLEADIVGQHLAQEGRAAKRVIQVLRTDDEGARAGAEALRRSLAEHGIEEQELRIGAAAPLDARTFDRTSHADAVVLWLRADDLKRLDGVNAVPSQVYVSATLADTDAVPLPAAWKARTLVAYPFELPQDRAARMAPLHAWLKARGVPMTAERVQADAYVACSALVAGMNQAADHLHRDYLVERLEAIMERGTATGLYPRLALGAGQRFASKTGYLVRFEHPESERLMPVGERVAP